MGTYTPVLGCAISYLHVCSSCEHTFGVYVLELFLETAAVEGIMQSANTDIPRMPSSVSDPGGGNIAETKDTHTWEEVAFHHLFQRANCTQWGHILLQQRAQGDTYSCNTWDRITSLEKQSPITWLFNTWLEITADFFLKRHLSVSPFATKVVFISNAASTKHYTWQQWLHPE